MNRLNNLCMFACVGIALMGGLGCGGDGSKMVHDDGALYYIEAMKARTHDEDKCLELLGKSIEEKPTASAYFHRAWIYAKRGSYDTASENVALGLELNPEDKDLLWLAEELKKPESKRSFKMPPTTLK